MKIEQAAGELRILANDAYCGVEQKLALYPDNPGFTPHFRAFIELSCCPTCNKGGQYLQAEGKCWESVLLSMKNQLLEMEEKDENETKGGAG